MQDATAAVSTDAVTDDQVTAGNADPDAVAAEDKDAVPRPERTRLARTVLGSFGLRS